MDNERAINIIRALADGTDPNTGEFLPKDSVLHRAEVIRSLNQAIAVLGRADRQERLRGPLPPNTGKAWSRVEDQQICEEMREGKSFQEIAASHGRTTTSIVARLVRLGKITAPNVPAKAA